MTKEEEAKYNATEAGLNNLDAVVDEFKAGNIAYINYDGKIERKGRNLSESLLWLGKHHFASMTAADRALTALHAGLSVKENSELGWAARLGGLDVPPGSHPEVLVDAPLHIPSSGNGR